MEKGKEILSSVVIFSKYAKYDNKLQRRETWKEIIKRYQQMLEEKFPSLVKEIKENIHYILDKKILPSMRALQFAGIAAEVNNTRIYNCGYLPIDSIHAFSETMFLLLGGTGVGYSVQKQHVDKLPAITKPTKTRRFLIGDDIMGWADAVKALMKAYTCDRALPLFDFRAIRLKGSRLFTSGGKAPGPEPLRTCLFHIQQILERKETGDKLSTLECHDIECHIANAVLAGGIRRAAMISLFSHDDTEMLECKYGSWWEQNEQRGRANNSAMLLREEVSEEEFKTLWEKIEMSGSGEPGIYWTNDLDWGTNPCCEVALRSFQFCNLCEINVDNVESQFDLNQRAYAAAFFGTLQASFTDFHYLRPIWKRTTEKDALIGIGMTGIGSGKILDFDLSQAAAIVIDTNKHFSEKISINQAARNTLIKPSGTTSLVLGCSSGIHAWHNKFYLRTLRFNLDEDIAQYLWVNHPELCEVDKLRSDVLCVRIPIKAPENAIMRTETAIDLLERVKKFSTEWIKPGHIDGVNTHNVSATISIDKNRKYKWDPLNGLYDKEIDEWKAVGNWVWKNRDIYNGLSVLPYDGGSYIQAPFEECTEKEYEKRLSSLNSIDLKKVTEFEDNTEFTQIASCAGGKCEVV